MGTELGINYSAFGSAQNQNTLSNRILARVDKVILGPVLPTGDADADFKANGGWSTVGSIRYTVMYGASVVPNINTSLAKPYYPSNTQYPLIGEIVELVVGPSTRLNESTLEKDLYYLNPINLWNSVHHNAFPNFYNILNQNSNTQVSYTDTTRGVNTSPVTDPKPVSLGSTFVEKSNLRNLQPFEGDVIYQGRWGQSIRFSSTVKNSSIKNPWSSRGESGDPIVIIRSGQSAPTGTDPWVPVVEDINTDPSSIYVCAGQYIVIQDLNNFKLDSFIADARVQETQVQTLTQTPISTDTKSPASQSAAELKYAQASTAINVPTTIPQKKVEVLLEPGTLQEPSHGQKRIVGKGDIQIYDTVTARWLSQEQYSAKYTSDNRPKPNALTKEQLATYQLKTGITLQISQSNILTPNTTVDTRSPGLNTTSSILNIVTTTYSPDGTTSTKSVKVAYAPVAGISPNSTVNSIVSASATLNIASSATTKKPAVVRSEAEIQGQELEVILAEEESTFRFNFETDLTEATEFGDGAEENVPLQGVTTPSDPNAPLPSPANTNNTNANTNQVPSSAKTAPITVPNNIGGAGTGPRAIVPDVSKIPDSRVEIIPGRWETNNGTFLTNLSHVDGKPVCVPMMKPLLAMKDACLAETKQVLRVGSGFRPPFENITFTTKTGVQIWSSCQLKLCGPNGSKGCAPPRRSQHGNGIAIDVNTGTKFPIPTNKSPWNQVIGEWMFKNSWKYGFVRGVKSEEWHFEYRPGNTVFSIVPRGNITWHGIDAQIPTS